MKIYCSFISFQSSKYLDGDNSVQSKDSLPFLGTGVDDFGDKLFDTSSMGIVPPFTKIKQKIVKMIKLFISNYK